MLMTMNHYLPLHHWVQTAGSKDQTKNLMQGKMEMEMEMELMPIFSIPYKRNRYHEDDTFALARRG
jgi:hypothetical protein